MNHDLTGDEATTLLDAIPGAWEQAQEGMRDAREGRTVRLDDFVRNEDERGGAAVGRD